MKYEKSWLYRVANGLFDGFSLFDFLVLLGILAAVLIGIFS